MTYNNVPADYGQVYAQYFHEVESVCRQVGIYEADDAASEILVRFERKDALHWFNPHHVAGERDESDERRFRRFISGFARKHALGVRDKELVRRRREVLPKSDHGIVAEMLIPAAASAEVVAMRRAFDLRMKNTVGEIQAYLDQLPPRSSRDILVPGQLFRSVRRQYVVEGVAKPDRKRLAAEYGVSVSAIGSWLAYMNERIQGAGFELEFA